jgi:hypothetical protein
MATAPSPSVRGGVFMGKIGDAVGITFVATIGVSSIDAEVSRNSMRLKKAWQELRTGRYMTGP